MAEVASAAEPTSSSELGTHALYCQPMVTTSPLCASLPGSAVRRQNLKEEPSAVVPHAGIRAGGCRQRQSLPRKRVSMNSPAYGAWNGQTGVVETGEALAGHDRDQYNGS